MSRFAASLRNEIRIQVRNGFYWVSLGILPVLIGVLIFVRDGTQVPLTPVLVVTAVTNLVITTWFFMAALVLLERDEGVLSPLTVTPLRPLEYLLAKGLPLSLLAAAETGAAIAITRIDGIDIPVLMGTMVLLGLLYTACGFVAAAPHRAINTFLPPSILWVVLLFLPLLGYFDLWSHGVWLAHPVNPAINLIDAALRAEITPRWQDGLMLTVWVLLFTAWARMRFVHHIRLGHAGGGA